MAIVCERHGAGESRFVCQHLLADAAERGFFVDDGGDTAWCMACESVWDTQGEWNDVVRNQLKIRHVCDDCFEEIRERAS